jgi:hypothetical protein
MSGPGATTRRFGAVVAVITRALHHSPSIPLNVSRRAPIRVHAPNALAPAAGPGTFVPVNDEATIPAIPANVLKMLAQLRSTQAAIDDINTAMERLEAAPPGVAKRRAAEALLRATCRRRSPRATSAPRARATHATRATEVGSTASVPQPTPRANEDDPATSVSEPTRRAIELGSATSMSEACASHPTSAAQPEPAVSPRTQPIPHPAARPAAALRDRPHPANHLPVAPLSRAVPVIRSALSSQTRPNGRIPDVLRLGARSPPSRHPPPPDHLHPLPHPRLARPRPAVSSHEPVATTRRFGAGVAVITRAQHHNPHSR